MLLFYYNFLIRKQEEKSKVKIFQSKKWEKLVKIIFIFMENKELTKIKRKKKIIDNWKPPPP